MHRTIEITVPPQHTNQLLADLAQLPPVVGLTVHRGASIKPLGDLLTVHTLNRGADEVMRLAQAVAGKGQVSIATAELASIVDITHQNAIDDDVDEAIWEEMEAGLRHHGRITFNFLVLMAVGGAIAAAGLVSDPAHQAIAFVASAIIAPGFEPIAKIPLGVVLRNWAVVRAGLESMLAGYAVLIGAAALTFAGLRWADSTTVAEFTGNLAVEHLTHPSATELAVSVGGAIAGMIMILAYRRNVIAGPLIALVLIPAAAMMGMALVIGRWDLLLHGLERLGWDILLIVAAGVLLVYLKQQWVHRRSPLR